MHLLSQISFTLVSTCFKMISRIFKPKDRTLFLVTVIVTFAVLSIVTDTIVIRSEHYRLCLLHRKIAANKNVTIYLIVYQ
jgi:hypothetical protein